MRKTPRAGLDGRIWRTLKSSYLTDLLQAEGPLPTPDQPDRHEQDDRCDRRGHRVLLSADRLVDEVRDQGSARVRRTAEDLWDHAVPEHAHEDEDAADQDAREAQGDNHAEKGVTRPASEVRARSQDGLVDTAHREPDRENHER